jgi:hypothetical protein
VPATRARKPVVKRAFEAALTQTKVREEQIRSRAFEIFQNRVRAHAPGDDVSDWLRAENELKNPTVSLRM